MYQDESLELPCNVLQFYLKCDRIRLMCNGGKTLNEHAVETNDWMEWRSAKLRFEQHVSSLNMWWSNAHKGRELDMFIWMGTHVITYGSRPLLGESRRCIYDQVGVCEMRLESRLGSQTSPHHGYISQYVGGI